MKNIILLSYFDTKIGPKVFYSYPKELLAVNLKQQICKFIDLDYNSGYLILVKEDMKIFNFLFEIPSELSRGNIEILSLSVIVDRNISLEEENTIYNHFKSFKQKILNDKEIYYGFYQLIDHPDAYKCLEKKALLEYIIEKLHGGLK